MSIIEKNNLNQFEKLIAQKQYDFLDFGTSKGGSIKFAQKHLMPNSKGLGIDIDQKKVDFAIKEGFDTINFDIELIPSKQYVQFCVLSHFLEHLFDLRTAQSMLLKACQVSGLFHSRFR